MMRPTVAKRTPFKHVRLVAALVVPLLACDLSRRNAGILPVSGVPFLDTDPLPTPPPRATFAAAHWVAVTTGHGVMPEPVGKTHPSVVGALVETHGGTYDVRTVVRLRRLAFGRLPSPPQAVEVDAEALAELGFEPPGDHVWLFGPEGLCRSTVTTPLVGVYDGPGEVLELSWRLEGCMDFAWAPVGLVGEALPPQLQWVWAQPVLTTELDPHTGWTHPLSTAIQQPPPSESFEPVDAHAVHVLQVVGPEPAPIEVLYAHLQYDPEVPDDPCPIDERIAATHGFWDGRGLQTFDPVVNAVDIPLLLGAIVHGAEVEALVYADGPNVAIAVPPTPPPPEPEDAPQQMADFDWGPPNWTHLSVPTLLPGAAELEALRWPFPLPDCPR